MFQGASADTSVVIKPGDTHKVIHQDNLEHRFHRDGALSSHVQGQEEEEEEDVLVGLKPPGHAGIRDPEVPFGDLPVCSTSLLFSQLRFVESTSYIVVHLEDV